ncbi:MAG TPA: hypothetical protein VH682_21755 [Gemmataceae bacterium]
MQPSDTPSNPPIDLPPSNKAHYRRSILAAVVFGLLLCTLPAGYFWWKGVRKSLPKDPEEALRVATEEADRLDPGWRFDELQAKRVSIPDAENSALSLIAAHERLPKDWPTWRSLDRLAGRELERSARDRYYSALRDVRAVVQFNEQQLAVMRGEVREADAALTAARKLADLPHGRLPPGPLSKSPVPGSNPHLFRVRKIMELLQMDAWVRTQDGELDNALESCRAILNAGRAIGDEPDSIAQLVRVACQSVAVQQLERALAQGMPSPAALVQTQQLLEEEAEAPMLLAVARGERASAELFFQKAHEGTIPPAELEQLEKMATSLRELFPGSSGQDDSKGPAEQTEKWYAAERINRYRAWYLRYSTDLVEICKRPGPAPVEALKKLATTLKGQPDYLQCLGGGMEKVAENCWRGQTQLRCAAVALAVERYRQANGDWPNSLAALVPGQIARIPADPYDGRPLRYRRGIQVVGVYSIGPDRKDDGGDLREPIASQQAADVGFRLWRPKLRRLPPSPEQPLDELPGKDDE